MALAYVKYDDPYRKQRFRSRVWEFVGNQTGSWTLEITEVGELLTIHKVKVNTIATSWIMIDRRSAGKKMSLNSEDLRDRFLAWQCLVRQRAMRISGGRPSDGMRPHVSLTDGGNYSGRVTLLLVHKSPHNDISQFKHMMKKTHDPADRYSAALKYLAATYYQRAQEFSDQLTGSFAPDSLLSRALSARGSCILEFGQFSQRFKMQCEVQELPRGSEAYEVTFWHNSLFNPRIPPDIKILGFQPRWATAEFEESSSSL